MPTLHPGVLGRTLGHLLMPAAAMLAVACEDSPLPQEPPGVEAAEPAGEAVEASSVTRWYHAQLGPEVQQPHV